MPKRRTEGTKGSGKGRTSHVSIPEIISLVFVMGQFMREKMHDRKAGRCSLFEFETLRYVREREHECPLMSDIAKKFHVAPPSATLLIDGLVKQRLLERLVDPADRRSVRVGLTKKGKKILDEGMARKVREMRKVFDLLSPSERTQFASILRKITKNGS